MLTTRRKLMIARAISQALCSARAGIGLGHTVTAERGRLRWQLDLREGIDLAIYLGAYQRLGSYIRRNVLRPGMSVLDIGANIGAFTLPLAAAIGPAGRVVAIEATRFAFAKLQTNLALNPNLARRVLPVQAILGSDDDRGPTEEQGLYSSWLLDEAGTGQRHPTHGGRRMSTEGAIRTTLDALLQDGRLIASGIREIGFLKLDVDGHELPVLRGAGHLLRAQRPSVLIEIAPYVQDEQPGGLDALLAEIVRLNYRLRHPDNGAPIAATPEAIRRRIPHGAGMDVLCTPE
jgi:FkbM family methyltransferase